MASSAFGATAAPQISTGINPGPAMQMTNFFASLDKKVVKLVEFASASFQLDKERDREEDVKQSLTDTDDKRAEDGGSILDSLREQFDSLKEGFGNITIGEKLKAALLVGALALFVKVSDSLVPVVTKIVEVFQKVGDFFFGEEDDDATKKTLFGLFAGLLAIKFGPLVLAAAKATANVASAAISLGSKAFLAGKDSLFFVFDKLNKAGKLAVKGAGKAFEIIEGGFKGIFNLLGKGFSSIRKGLIALRLNVAATVAAGAPLLLVAGIAAAIGAVLFSLKSAFDTFKMNLDEGDSMMTALGKSILDFVATLTTLPFTLVKKAVGYIADLFGFPSVKEKLDSIDFKEMFVNIITGFVTKVKNFFADVLRIDIGNIVGRIGDLGAKVANTLKAIAKGSVAMIAAAAPGGESPTEAFSRVYNEVLSQGESAEPTITKDSVADKEIEEASTTMAAAKSAVTQDAAYTTDNRVFNTTHNTMQSKIITILEHQLELANLKFKMDLENQKSMMVVNKGGDSVTQNSNTFQAGTANSDHTDKTAKILTDNVQ